MLFVIFTVNEWHSRLFNMSDDRMFAAEKWIKIRISGTQKIFPAIKSCWNFGDWKNRKHGAIAETWDMVKTILKKVIIFKILIRIISQSSYCSFWWYSPLTRASRLLWLEECFFWSFCFYLLLPFLFLAYLVSFFCQLQLYLGYLIGFLVSSS